MKVAYMFVATGRYNRFIPELLESGTKNFFPKDDTEFIVWTDDKQVAPAANLRVVEQSKLGWPFDTLFRYKLINQIASTLDHDYLFFGNANMRFEAPIGAEILPSAPSGLVMTVHPMLTECPSSQLPYERNPVSTAYVPYDQQTVGPYCQGCFFGGTREAIVKMSAELEVNIDADYNNHGHISPWWDESHMNKYILTHRPTLLTPSYAYPDQMQLPRWDRRIVQLEKSLFGGHDFLRAKVS